MHFIIVPSCLHHKALTIINSLPPLSYSSSATGFFTGLSYELQGIQAFDLVAFDLRWSAEYPGADVSCFPETM